MSSPVFAGVPEPQGFKGLSKRDQVLYLQALWDRVADGSTEMLPVPASHLALAEERLAAHRAAPERARPALEIFDRLTRRPA